MAREIALAAFAVAHAEGAFVVDVREPGEYRGGHVPGARLMPLATLPRHLDELPRDRPVYVVCASGHRSGNAADRMCASGVDAYSVAGGTGAWANSGRPVVPG